LNYSLLFGGIGVSVGDVIQYFVVAQDLSPQQNVGINSGTFNSQPSSVNLTTANFPIGGTINSYPIVESISGTILVGSGETFTTLTANNSQGLFRYINERVVVGNITVSITSNTTEPGEVSLDETVDEGSNYITFQPSSASEKIVFSSAAYPAAVIKINGADRIIFDGRFGGGGNYLSFVNSDFTGSQAIAAIQIISLGPNAGATGITIRNCNISTYYSNGVTSYGITSGGATVGTAGYDNDNLTMIDNVITRALYGININGNAAGKANNIIITGNAIGSDTPINYIGKYGIHIIWADDVNISGNNIFNIISDYQSLYGISLSTGVTNAVISANKIYSIRYTGDVSWGGIGIEISKSGNNANNLISNNLIYDIWGDGGNYDSFLDHNPFGIYLGSDQTGIKVYNNSINLYGNSLNKSGAISVGIGLNSLSFADIRNNIIVNNLGLESGTGYGSVGIFLKTGSSQLVSSNNNIIFVNPSGSGVKYIGQINATGYSNLQSWRTATGKDNYSYSGAPAFTSNTNLLPNNSNPDCWVFNNKGMPLTDVATDFNGVLRSTTVAGGPVDIGAYEFDAATNIYPPIALQGGIIGNGLTTTYNVFEFESASMSWSGTSLPSTIELRFYSGIEPPGADNNTSKCYWDITQTGGSSFTYDITFTYDPAQIGVITSEDDIRLAKSNDNGVNWIPFLSSGTGAEHYLLNTADNTIKVHGLSSFSLFALTDVDGALPVELNSFSAAVSGRDINLKWETETEVNSYGFEIERASSSSTPLQGWEKVGFVEGHGNSNSPKKYSFTDKNLNSGKYIYRLKMVDNDGTYDYSPEVESEIEVPKEFLLSQNYPNPFNPSTKIDYQLPFESNVTIELYNITGERVEVLVNQEQAAGYYSVEVNSSQFRLSSGVYIYRMTAVSSKDAKSYTQLKKMVLLK